MEHFSLHPLILPSLTSRAVSTGNTDCVCAMLNHIGSSFYGPVLQYFVSRVESAFKTG